MNFGSNYQGARKAQALPKERSRDMICMKRKALRRPIEAPPVRSQTTRLVEHVEVGENAKVEFRTCSHLQLLTGASPRIWSLRSL